MMKLLFTITLLALNIFSSYANIPNSPNKNEQATKQNQKKPVNNFAEYPCYAVSNEKDSPNVFFEYDPFTDSWEAVGLTGTASVEAITTDPITDIIFATDGGTFGIIDQNTGVFSPIGEVGKANGDFGEINLDDIDGLTYDPINQFMYATHRISGEGPETNDLLFQIDIATGAVVSGAMLDSNGNPIDYSVIPEIFDGTLGSDVYDVEDIAYDPYLGILYVLHSQNIITELNPYSGDVIAVIYDLVDQTTGAMGMSSFGELLVTTKSASEQLCILNVPFIDRWLDNNPFCYNINTNVEAFDCSTAFNDLALTLDLDSSVQEPVDLGSEVTFIIAVYNQGDIDNSEITIINYTPEGLTLSDPNWTNVGNGNAQLTLNGPLQTGASFVAPITFTVNSDYNGQSITNAAEIVSTFNFDIIDRYGNPVPLPDIDSNPDDYNGNDGQDCINCDPDFRGTEDDYDTASLRIQQANNIQFLMSNTQPENCNTLGSATIQMLAGTTPPFTHQWKNLAGDMVHNQTNSNTQYQVTNLKAGEYEVTITDAANQVNTFTTLIPFMAPLSGNTNCNNACPAYVIVSNGSASGNFKAEQVLEIKGYVEKTNNALFAICE